MIDIKEIPKILEKLGDGEYRIKIKNSKIVIFSKNNRYEKDDIKKIIGEVWENEKDWIYLRMWYNEYIKYF